MHVALINSLKDEEPENNTENTKEITDKILKKYADVFPSELPSTLPPWQSVNHEIKLYPGHDPPSKPAY
jgi:hypothetical protein